MTTFAERLDSAVTRGGSLLCVGLDPDPAKIPVPDVASFNRAIVDATHDLVCAFKPQLAFYEALGIEGLRALEATVSYIRAAAPHVLIVGDGKRGDVGATARFYAKAMFEGWGFDATTVNAYMGFDAVAPFLEYSDRGTFIVCRSSNEGAREFQDLPAGKGGEPLYMKVAEAAERWNSRGNVGLVVGATYPRELGEIRSRHPNMPILIPGVGAQGGDVAAAVRAGVDPRGRGIIVNASRAVIYASSEPGEFAKAAREAATRLRAEIERSAGVRAG